MIEILATFELPQTIVTMLRYIGLIVLLIGAVLSQIIGRTGHAVACVLWVFFVFALLIPDVFGPGSRIVLFYAALFTTGGIPTWHFLRR